MVALGLTACAPGVSSPGVPNPGSADIAALSLNPSGALACISSGRAFTFQDGRWSPLPAPASAASLAWRDGAWWLALPNTGLVYRATGVPQNLSFTGRPALLSSRFVFTLEGDARDYGGGLIARIGGLPSSLLDTDSSTFVIIGSTVYSLGPGLERRVSLGSGRYSLVVSPTTPGEGFEVLLGLAARGDGYTYRVTDNTLVAQNSAGQEIARASLTGSATRLVAAGGLVAVAIGDRLELYRAARLAPVYAGRCGGAA